MPARNSADDVVTRAQGNKRLGLAAGCVVLLVLGIAQMQGSNPLSRAAVATKISASSEVPQFSLLTSGSGGRDAWHVPPEARYLQVLERYKTTATVTSTSGHATKPSVLWGYTPLLLPEGLQRGLASLGSLGRLRRVVAKLLRGESAQIAFVGTSVTQGAGAGKLGNTTWPGFAWQFSDWLAAAFPAANLTVHHLGEGGSTPNYWDACGYMLLPQDLDLVLLELTTLRRDGCNFTGAFDAAYERLLRKLLQQPGHPAVVSVNTYAFQAHRQHFYGSFEPDVTEFSFYYGLPILSLRNAVFPFILEGRRGYQADRYRNQTAVTSEDLMYWDYVHPYGNTGHRYLAELLIHLVRLTTALVLSTSHDAGASTGPAGSIPDPMIRGNFERKGSACLVREAFQPAVQASEGFAWINERPNAPSPRLYKWGWVATTSGAWADLRIDSRTNEAGSADAAELNEVFIGYLASYTGMGQASVACVSGCSCTNSTFDGHWETKASMSMAHGVLVTQHPQCTLRVTVLPTSSSGGHKVKLTSIVLMGQGSYDFSRGDFRRGTGTSKLDFVAEGASVNNAPG